MKNEQIKELFKQAGGVTSIHNLMSNPMQQREYHELWDDRIEKFAILVVKECLTIAQDYAAFDWAPPNDVNRTIEEIKHHFGIEE